MEVEINDDGKLAVVWLSKNEGKEMAQPVIDQYQGSGYRVVVFRSGKAGLVQNTAALLKHNKELFAPKAVV